MDTKDLATAKRALGVQVEQKVREFEQAPGLEVTGIKIKHDGQGIEDVSIAIAFPE